MARVGERYELELQCDHCRRTTIHSVALDTAGVSRVTCIVCGRAVGVRRLEFVEQYVGSVVRRLLEKPFEVTTEFARSPRTFLASLPGRVLTKPIRVAAELRTTLDIVRFRHTPSPGLRRVRESRPPGRTRQMAREAPRATRRCKVFLSAPLLWSHRPEEMLEVACDLGYDGVELWAYHLLLEQSDPAVLAARARRLGLGLALHALSWDLNPTSRLETIRDASIAALHRSVDLAAALDARLVVVHPGKTTVPYDDDTRYWPVLVAVIREIADQAASMGITLGVEHMEPRQKEYVVTPDDANRLLREVSRPNVGTVLDVAHIPWGEDEVSFLHQLDRVVHVHFSDADEDHLHLPLGRGARNLLRVLAALRDFEGAIALEGFSISVGTHLARWSKAQFEELWPAAVAFPEVGDTSGGALSAGHSPPDLTSRGLGQG